MADLETQVRSSADQLRVAWQTANQKPAGTALPMNCYEQWETAASLHSCLTNIVPLFEVRRQAFHVMQSLISPERTKRESKRESQQASDSTPPVSNFTFDRVPMDFELARHLATTGYVCVSWSLYDRLANVCGRLAAWKDIPDHPWQDPKLWGNLMGEGNKTIGGFNIQKPLLVAYGWPTGVAYKIRNWLVHDGGDIGRLGLFLGKRATDAFTLHDDAVIYLEHVCKYKCENGQIDRCCLSAAEEPWHSRDLIKILDKYHAEIDTMLTYLVQWCVDSLVGQITVFSERDRQVFMKAAATASPSKS